MSKQPQEECAQMMTSPHVTYLTEQEINLTKTNKNQHCQQQKKFLFVTLN